MPDPSARDWFQRHQDRRELEEAVETLSNFIYRVSSISEHQSQRLAMQILENGESSGCVSAARAARLLAEADHD